MNKKLIGHKIVEENILTIKLLKNKKINHNKSFSTNS